MLVVAWILVILIFLFFFFSSIGKGKALLLEKNHLSDITLEDKFDSYSYDAEKIEDISVNCIDESLLIQHTDEPEISVVMYGGWEAQNEPKISFKNGILRIIQEASSDMYERLLVINLPAASVGENTNINVEHVEKDIAIKNIKINKLNVINKNGLIQIENIEAKNIFAKNNAGGIKILESNVEEINAETYTGAINLSGKANKIDAKSNSGSIETHYKTNFKDDCSFQTTVGSINLFLSKKSSFILDCSSLDSQIQNDFTETKTSGNLNQNVGTNPKHKIVVKTESGFVLVSKNE